MSSSRDLKQAASGAILTAPYTLTKMSVQISYRASSGFGCSVGFRGGNKDAASAGEALIDALTELVEVARMAGLGETALAAIAKALGHPVADTTAPLPQVPGEIQ